MWSLEDGNSNVGNAEKLGQAGLFRRRRDYEVTTSPFKKTQKWVQASRSSRNMPGLLRVDLVVVTSMMMVSLQGSMAIRVPTSFEVGGPLGWGFPRYPTFYDDWQSSNMPYITGDTLDFQYGRDDDSVLVVNQDDYNTCNVMHPIQEWTDGPHDFTLQGYSMAYFISAAPGHCQAGQKMRIETFRT